MEPFFATCSPMRPAMLIYVKNCKFSLWGVLLKPQKVDFRALFQKKIDFLLKPVGFYYFLALFWPPRTFLISKKPPACNAGHFLIKKSYFWSKLTNFITFLSKNTSFWAPNLSHGKPDTYDPLTIFATFLDMLNPNQNKPLPNEMGAMPSPGLGDLAGSEFIPPSRNKPHGESVDTEFDMGSPIPRTIFAQNCQTSYINININDYYWYPSFRSSKGSRPSLVSPTGGGERGGGGGGGGWGNGGCRELR